MEQQSSVKGKRIKESFQEAMLRRCFKKEGMGVSVENAISKLSKVNLKHFYLLETRNSLVFTVYLY